MEIVFVLCGGPPILAVLLCFGCYVGLRRAIGRERVEAGYLAEELCILIGKGQLDRAQSRVRAANAGALWEMPVQLIWAMSGVGAIGCAIVGTLGWFLIPWWAAESDGLPDGRALVVSLFAGLGLVAVRLVATSTCKLMERERQAIQEQTLEALPGIYGPANSPSSSRSA